MNHGKIEQAADPITLYRDPANMFVAVFIGAPSMNFLPGSIKGGQFIGERWGASFAIPAGHLAPGIECADAICGIRPEHMQVGVANALMVKQKIKVVEPLGPFTLQVGLVDAVPFTAQVLAMTKVVLMI